MLREPSALSRPGVATGELSRSTVAANFSGGTPDVTGATMGAASTRGTLLLTPLPLLTTTSLGASIGIDLGGEGCSTAGGISCVGDALTWTSGAGWIGCGGSDAGLSDFDVPSSLRLAGFRELPTLERVAVWSPIVTSVTVLKTCSHVIDRPANLTLGEVGLVAAKPRLGSTTSAIRKSHDDVDIERDDPRVIHVE